MRHVTDSVVGLVHVDLSLEPGYGHFCNGPFT